MFMPWLMQCIYCIWYSSRVITVRNQTSNLYHSPDLLYIQINYSILSSIVNINCIRVFGSSSCTLLIWHSLVLYGIAYICVVPLLLYYHNLLLPYNHVQMYSIHMLCSTRMSWVKLHTGIYEATTLTLQSHMGV